MERNQWGRLVTAVRMTGIFPFGFSGHATYHSLGNQERANILGAAIDCGYDPNKNFDDMFEEILVPMGYEIRQSVIIGKYYDDCVRTDWTFVTVRRGFESLANIKPENEWSPSMRSKRPRCGLCDKRETCEYFNAGLIVPRSYPYRRK